MPFVKKEKLNKDKAQSIKTEIVDLLDHQDDITLLNLTRAHKNIIYDMGVKRIHEFNKKEVLDLVGWGVLIPNSIDELNGGVFGGSYALTDYGYAIAHYLKTNSKRRYKPHDLLALKFARSKERQNFISFLDIQLKTKNYDICRPDVFCMKPTYNEIMVKPTAFEIKVSRSDFLSDMSKPDKWKAYFEIAETLYYVCPENLIDKKEVPKECGLIYFNSTYSSFEMKKHAKRGEISLSQENMMRLILHTKKNNETTLIKSANQ